MLGDEDGKVAADLFGVTPEGTFEDGASTLRLLADTPFEDIRYTLLDERAKRPQPGRDDKVIASWNGLVITALAEAGAALDRPQWIQWAVDAAELLLRVHVVDGRLRRSSRDGVVGESAGVLEDYACVADGFLALHQATGEAKWLTEATRLLDLALTHFASPDVPGAYFDTADDAETLVQRPADPGDNASPAGASALAGALLTASALAGHESASRYREAAEQAVRRVGVLMRPGAAVHRALAVGRGGDAGRSGAGRGGRCRPGVAPRGGPRRPRRRHRAGGCAGRPGRPAAGRPPAGQGRRGGVRLPRLRLRPPGHHPGSPRRPALTVTFT